MVRVKRGSVAKNRRKRVLKFAKGCKGAHSRLFRTANGQVMKAFVYSESLLFFVSAVSLTQHPTAQDIIKSSL